jgi:hypothetical protein
MKLIIAGGRDFNDLDLLKMNADSYLGQVTEVVCGKARGADTLGEHWAIWNSLPVKYFPADWEKYGKRAGYLRNKEMAEYADSLLAFWDGKSRGTKHMIDLATELGLKVKVIQYEDY